MEKTKLSNRQQYPEYENIYIEKNINIKSEHPFMYLRLICFVMMKKKIIYIYSKIYIRMSIAVVCVHQRLQQLISYYDYEHCM